MNSAASVSSRLHGGSARFTVSRLTKTVMCVGAVMLVLFDWSYDFELIRIPVSKALRAVLLIVFTAYLAKSGLSFRKSGFSFTGVLLFFASLNLAYAFVSPDIMGNLYYSTRILFWLFGTLVAYRLAFRGFLSRKDMERTVAATIILAAIFTIGFMTQFDNEAGQNASAYLLLWCIPLWLIVNNSFLGKLLLALAVVAILITVKRGAIVALGISVLAYGLAYIATKRTFLSTARIVSLFVFLGIIGAATLLPVWGSVVERFQDTTGSGRSYMYPMLIEHWLGADPLNFVFGFGINSVQQYTGYMFSGNVDKLGPYAHSDWFQLMHDFGILGIICLVWLHAKFLLLIRTSYGMRHPYTPPLVMGYVILFLVNIYSGHLLSPNAIYCGFLLALGSAAIRGNQILGKRMVWTNCNR